MKESNEISEHLLRVFSFVEKTGWCTAAQIAEGACVAPRTARAHALRLANLGVFDQAEVFPGHRYRVSPMAAKRNKGMVDRIRKALSVFNNGSA